MIHSYNYFFTRLFNTIMAPFDRLGDFWGILFLSLISSLFVLVVYKYLSSPNKIKQAKNQIKSNILAIRLYRDFWKVIVVSFLRSLFYTLKYFALNFGPLILILPILAPVFAQMDVRYGMRPFKAGETLVVKARFSKNPRDLQVRLSENENFSLKMNPVYVTALNEVNWKINIKKEGTSDLKIQVGESNCFKSLKAGKYLGSLSNRKYRDSCFSHFIYPVETRIDEKSPVESVSIKYPVKLVSFAGTRIHWIIHYLVLMLVIVLGLRKRFGVEF